MKINKFNEDNEFYIQISNLESRISDIIQNEVCTRDVPYGDGDVEVSSDSVELAAKEVVKYLKENGLLTALLANKYNI